MPAARSLRLRPGSPTASATIANRRRTSSTWPQAASVPPRPGRTVELLEATVVAGDRAAVRTRIWRLARFDTTGIAGSSLGPLVSPDGLERWPLDEVWSGGYIASLDVRPVGTPAA